CALPQAPTPHSPGCSCQYMHNVGTRARQQVAAAAEGKECSDANEHKIARDRLFALHPVVVRTEQRQSTKRVTSQSSQTQHYSLMQKHAKNAKKRKETPWKRKTMR
ncbi:MAG: hypothetical protein K8T25_04825, partial [Planctomycetia bacterium]|nr:hypothetical protein [Planctomycetia bacterium]